MSLDPEADHHQNYAQVVIERNKLLEYVIQCASEAGRINLPLGTTIHSLDYSQVSVPYVLECLRSDTNLVVPVTWTRHEPRIKTAPYEPHAVYAQAPPTFSPLPQTSNLKMGTRVPPLPPRRAIGVLACTTESPTTIHLPNTATQSLMNNASHHFWNESKSLLESPIGFTFPVGWMCGNQTMAEEAPNDWRFHSTPLSSPYTNEFSETAYEMALFISRHSPDSVKDTLNESIRPDLGVSVRRHTNLIKFMNSLGAHESIFSFRLAFLEAGAEAMGVSAKDADDWFWRQQYAVMSSVQWAYKPNEKSAPLEWFELGDAVKARNYSGARDILTEIQPTLSPYNLFIGIGFVRLISATLDPTDSHPDSAISDPLEQALQWCGKELLGVNSGGLWDLMVARAMWGWTYLAVGNPDHLPCILRRLERARRSISVDPSDHTAYWMELRARVHATLHDVHTWTTERVSSDAGLVAMVVEVCTRAMHGEDNTLPSAVVCTAVLGSKKQQLAQTLSKPVTLGELGNREEGFSLAQFCAFVPNWEAQVMADSTVIRPALGTVLSASDARKCLLQPAFDCLDKEIDRVVTGGSLQLGPEVIELMKILVDAETVAKSASDAIGDNVEVTLNLPTRFFPVIQRWISRQWDPFVGIIQRAVAGDPFTDPVNDKVRHTDSIITVLQYSRTMMKTILDLPVVCNWQVSSLVQTLHAGLHQYADLTAQPVGKLTVMETILRINNIMYLDRQWVPMRNLALTHAPGVASMNLGVRGFASKWLPRCSRALAVLVVEEMPWTAVYLPIAKSNPLCAEVVHGIDSAMNALVDLVDTHAHAPILADVAFLVVHTWIALVWSPPRVYLDTDYADVLENDIDLLLKVFAPYMPILERTAKGTGAIQLLNETRAEMEALMPIPSLTLVGLIQDPQPRSSSDLAHWSKVARVLLFRSDHVAKSAVKKYKLESGLRGPDFIQRKESAKFRAKTPRLKKKSAALSRDRLDDSGSDELGPI